MKRKLVNLLIDMLLEVFVFAFRLKDDSPGIPVTNFRELAEALAREGPIETPPIRPADMPDTVRVCLLPQNSSSGAQAAPSCSPGPRSPVPVVSEQNTFLWRIV